MKLHRPVTYKFIFNFQSKKNFFFLSGSIVQKKTGGKTLKIAIFRVSFLLFSLDDVLKTQNSHKCKNMQFLTKKLKVFLSGVILNDKTGGKMLKNCYFSEFCSFLHVL